MLAVGIFDVFDPGQTAEYFSAIIVAAITAGSVYAKERLDDAKRTRGDAVTKKWD